MFMIVHVYIVFIFDLWSGNGQELAEVLVLKLEVTVREYKIVAQPWSPRRMLRQELPATPVDHS